jgi:hypothetical protein
LEIEKKVGEEDEEREAETQDVLAASWIYVSMATGPHLTFSYQYNTFR